MADFQAPITRTAAALMLNDAGEVLMGLRASWKSIAPNRWDLIGGRLEPGESGDDALVREVQEEIGVTPTAFRLLATVDEPEPQKYGPMVHFIYLVTAWRGEPHNACDEHTEISWFAPADALALPNLTAFDFRALIALAQQSGG